MYFNSSEVLDFFLLLKPNSEILTGTTRKWYRRKEDVIWTDIILFLELESILTQVFILFFKLILTFHVL